MYGLEGILGNLVTSVATPAIGGAVGSMVGDTIQDEFMKQLTETTTGMLAGAATGAGIGYLTGGKSGAVSGLLTGGVGGGVGGYNAPEIANMFGLGSMPQQSVVPPQGSRGAVTGELLKGTEFNPQQTLVPPAGGVGPGAPGRGFMGLSQDTMSAIRDIGGAPPSGPVTQGMVNVEHPLETAGVTPARPAPTGFKGYADFLKKNYEPLAGGFYLGSAYGANQDTNQQAKDLKERMALTEAIETKRARDFARSVYAPKYADGGPVEVGLPATGDIPEFHVRVPAWMQEDTQREGGLAALQPGIRQGMAAGGDVDDRISQHQSIIDSKTAQAVQQQEAAEGRSLSGSEKKDIYDGVRTRVLNKAELGLGYIAPSAGLGSHISGLRRKAAGGYINLQPMGEQEHPQALIPRAQPYAAASPQRREVIEGFERGGLIDGEGDGMSDSIPAHIEGQEPVKVADGEYLIPKDIAAKYGPEKLKHMMTKVRAAAHAKKGKQIIQDAAKRALISSLSGVRA